MENLFILMENRMTFLILFGPNLLEMMLDECVSRCPSHDDHWMHAHELAAKAGIHLHLDHIASVGQSAKDGAKDGCEWLRNELSEMLTFLVAPC